MNICEKSYAAFLEFRRNFRLVRKIPPIVYCDALMDGGYEIRLFDGNTQIDAKIKSAGDIAHFEEHVLPFVEIHDVPQGQLVLTNNLGDSSTWIDTDNSVSVIAPPEGTEFLINSLTGTVDADVAFNSQSYHVAIWSGLTQSCPAFADETTSFGTPLYNPYAEVYSGWMKVAPSLSNQNWEAWVYFDMNVPAYRVINYSFSSLNDMIRKGSFSIVGKTISIVHSFKDLSVDLVLKSSHNDRIETYVSDHNPLSSPNSIPLQMCGVLLQYNEW